MACDVMAVRLHLPQIRVLEVLEDTPGALVVSVESTFRRLRCPQCGFKCHRVHDRRDKKIRDLEVSGRRTVLVWSRRRMVCDNCDSRFLEDHPAFEGALTARLSRRLVADAKVMTFSAAARRHGVHWHGVRALVDTWSALVAERRRSRRCSVLLVDETSMRKRHRYVTVIVNGDTGRTLAMVEHRSSAARHRFTGHRWCKGVKVVVSDGSKAYKSPDAHLGHEQTPPSPSPQRPQPVTRPAATPAQMQLRDHQDPRRMCPLKPPALRTVHQALRHGGGNAPTASPPPLYVPCGCSQTAALALRSRIHANAGMTRR